GRCVHPAVAAAGDAPAGARGVSHLGCACRARRALALSPSARRTGGQPAGRGAGVLRRRTGVCGADVGGGAATPAGLAVTYTGAVVLGVVFAIALDLLVLRTNLLRRKAFWTSYAIVLAF